MDTAPNDEGRQTMDQKALDGLSVAPPPEDENGASHPFNDVREALDAGDVKGLARNPSDENAKLDVALDETFPTSDSPSNTQPGKGKDPAPSSGYDEAAEKKLTTGN